MSVTKIITLTNTGNAAGPYYQVSCSNDCSTFGPCITLGSIYLPTIGSVANVDVYDTTTCIKLVNYNAECNNSVIHNFAASGSTTTTTAAPTTTTTTFSSNPCVCMEVVVTSDGASWAIFDCFGRNQNVVAMTAGTYNTCVAVVGGLPQIEFIYGTGTFTQVGNCKTGTCPPTTTTTSTTTTTCAPCYNWTITWSNFSGTTKTITWVKCDGTPDSLSVANNNTGQRAGNCANPTPNWNYDSRVFSVQAFNVCGNYCPTTTTTSTSTTTTEGHTTTTTTTTQSPLIKVGGDADILCAGGGTSVSTITYYSGTNICNSTYITALTFNTLSAGNYVMYDPSFGYVQYNKPGGIGTNRMDRVGGGCTSCSTLTTTTTTTTAAPIYYYNVTRYRCFPCGVDAINLLASSPVALVNNIYYNNGDGYVYYTNYGTGAGYVDVDLAGSAADAICSSACSI